MPKAAAFQRGSSEASSRWFTADEDGQDTRGCANVLTADRAAPSGASTFNSTFVDRAPV